MRGGRTSCICADAKSRPAQVLSVPTTIPRAHGGQQAQVSPAQRPRTTWYLEAAGPERGPTRVRKARTLWSWLDRTLGPQAAQSQSAAVTVGVGGRAPSKRSGETTGRGGGRRGTEENSGGRRRRQIPENRRKGGKSLQPPNQARDFKDLNAALAPPRLLSLSHFPGWLGEGGSRLTAMDR